MLVDVAARVPDFVGWGLDINGAICGYARRRAALAEVTRLTFLEGDCRQSTAEIPPAIATEVRVLTAASVANEFFADGTAPAVAWLSDLRQGVPGRTMLIADYYGRLGARRGSCPPEILLHDFIRLFPARGFLCRISARGGRFIARRDADWSTSLRTAMLRSSCIFSSYERLQAGFAVAAADGRQAAQAASR